MEGITPDYRGFNIAKEVMLNLAEEASGKRPLYPLKSCWKILGQGNSCFSVL